MQERREEEGECVRKSENVRKWGLGVRSQRERKREKACQRGEKEKEKKNTSVLV